MISVARSGKVILTLESLDVLRDEVAAGNVLPTDHYIVVGMPSWRLVSALPDDRSVSLPPSIVPDPEAEAAAVVRGQIATASMQIQELINARPLPKPERCKHCDSAEVRSARLVWQQSTRVGGAIDTNFDITVFGSNTLQGLDLKPPPEPRMPTESSGGCATIFVSVFTFILLFDLMVLPVVLGAEYFGLERSLGGRESLVFRGLMLSVGVLGGYLAFRGARALYRWDKRRSGRTIDSDCAVQLDRARVYARWRNTWICMSCGGRTVVVD